MKKVVFILMLLVSTSVFAGDYEDGLTAMIEGDRVTAFSKFKSAAEQRNAGAQYMVGINYLQGEGVIKDDKQAVFWLCKAAEQGHSDAQLTLAMLYYRGIGVPQDRVYAVYWTTKAAEQGNVGAQRELAWMYRQGEGIPSDLVQEYKWQSLANVAQGHEPARYLEKEMTRKQIAEARRLVREWKPR